MQLRGEYTGKTVEIDGVTLPVKGGDVQLVNGIEGQIIYAVRKDKLVVLIVHLNLKKIEIKCLEINEHQVFLHIHPWIPFVVNDLFYRLRVCRRLCKEKEGAVKDEGNGATDSRDDLHKYFWKNDSLQT